MTVRLPPFAWKQDLLESSFPLVWALEVPCSLRAGWEDLGRPALAPGFRVLPMGRAWFWGSHTGWVGA